MVFIFPVILFLMIGWGAVKLKRMLRQRRQTQQPLPTAPPQATAPRDALPFRLGAWRRGAMYRPQRASTGQRLAPGFRAWVEMALGHEAKLQVWLLALSPEQLQVLVEHLAAYCEQLKVKLTWLTERQLDVAPVLKSTTQEIVVAYCTGLWKATQIKSKLELFIKYQQFTQLTTEQQQQILQRELLARLALQDLVVVQSIAATLIGTETERQAKVIQAIQQVATQDWERFMTIFQNTIQPSVSENSVHHQSR